MKIIEIIQTDTTALQTRYISLKNSCRAIKCLWVETTYTDVSLLSSRHYVEAYTLLGEYSLELSLIKEELKRRKIK